MTKTALLQTKSKDYYTKWSKSDGEGQIYDISYVESYKMIKMNLISK